MNQVYLVHVLVSSLKCQKGSKATKYAKRGLIRVSFMGEGRGMWEGLEVCVISFNQPIILDEE